MEITNFIKGIAKKLGKWGTRAVSAIVIGIIVSLAVWGIVSLLSSEQPIEPNITSSSDLSPIVNTDSTQTVRITVSIDFKPPYVKDIPVTIQHDNPRTCYMVIEFEASEGFRFLPISDNLPENFIVEEGYEYKDGFFSLYYEP
jgi:hypothetical protein